MNRMMKPLPLVGALIAVLISQSATAVPPPNPTASDGYANTAGGSFTLISLVTPAGGVENTGFGADVLSGLTTGEDNTAYGAQSLRNVTTANDNTAVGTIALQSDMTGGYNTAVGSTALNTNGSGNDNTAVGYRSMLFNTSGSQNVAIGGDALGNTTTGTQNIALGYAAGLGLTSGSHNIYIGAGGNPTESGAIHIGDSIGHTQAFIGGVWGNTVTSGIDVVINPSGQLGTIVSSERYKKDIQDMGDASSKLLSLRPVTFRYKSDASQTEQYGLIAEEVAKVYPDLVARDDKGQVESVFYHELAPMLLNEVEKQAKELAELRAAHERDVADLRDLKQMFAAQNAALTKLQKEIDPQIRVAAR